MRLEKTYLNGTIELLDNIYGPERQAELMALSRLYNRFLGPITKVNLHRPDPLDLSIYSSSCSHSNVHFLIRDLILRAGMSEAVYIPAGGKGVTLQQALLGALGEMAERLLGVLHFQAAFDELVSGTYEELVQKGLRPISPADLWLFAPEQYAQPGFAYVPFRPDTPLRWIQGRELLTGKPVLVPAQLVLLYYKHQSGEAHIGYPTTGGLAFHSDRRRAILHGLYEDVERDAIDLRWFCRLAPQRLEINLAEFLDREFGARQLRMSTPSISEVRVYLNTLDLPIPVMCVVALDHTRSERAFLGGGGAWSTRERALTQALFELAQSRTALKFYTPMGSKNIRADSHHSEMTDFFDAAVYYGYAENISKMDWYLNGSDAVPWETVKTLRFKDQDEEYDAAIEWVGAAGLRPIVLDFGGTCWPGMSLIKVYVPELTQAAIPSHPYLGHPRFYEMPQKLGKARKRLQFSDLTNDPVPFP